MNKKFCFKTYLKELYRLIFIHRSITMLLCSFIITNSLFFYYITNKIPIWFKVIWIIFLYIVGELCIRYTTDWYQRFDIEVMRDDSNEKEI